MKFFNLAVLVFLLVPLTVYCQETSQINIPFEKKIIQRAEQLPLDEFVNINNAAEGGDVTAQVQLAVFYLIGKGIVSKDNVKALNWAHKAAAQGNADAEWLLGRIYSSGLLGISDNVGALTLFELAAEHGVADAIAHRDLLKNLLMGKAELSDSNRLLAIWKNGVSVNDFLKRENSVRTDAAVNYLFGFFNYPKDKFKAIKLLEDAADLGDAGAQNFLGMLYASVYPFTHVIPKDSTKALKWFQKASAQNFAIAQYHLGNLYSSGNGVPRNDVTATDFYRKAAAQGHSEAQFQLFGRYLIGRGVSKDMAIAYAWWDLAHAQGNKNAIETSKEIEIVIPRSGIVEGQRLASNWKLGDTFLPPVSSASSNEQTIKQGSDYDGHQFSILSNDITKLTKQSTGTAFVVSMEGHAITNHHVINGCAEVKISGNGGVARVIASDSVNDLALLKFPSTRNNVAKLNPDPGKLRQGEDIIVFGYPLNYVLSSGGNLTLGTISAMTGLGNNSNQIQITAPIQPGSSGSPVLDKLGDLVAVVSMKLDDTKMAEATGQVGQNVNFAVNGQTVKTFLDANNVAYKTGGGMFSFEKSNADIADEARKWTFIVECWK